jgi:hypothetical protein
MARWLIGAAAALSALATPAAAADRAAGDIFFRCHIRHSFSLPGFLGGTPIWARPGRPNAPAGPRDSIEQIDASAEMDEKDGALSNLSISWVQSGRLGWPYVWRADIHPVYLIASFLEEDVAAASGPAFDPAKLRIKITHVSDTKLNRDLDFRLWRDGQDRTSLMLGGPADVALQRKSADVSIAWPELAAYAKGDRWLHYGLYRSRPAGSHVRRWTVHEGRVDLSIMPALLEQFRKAEQALRTSIAERRDCVRNVEPELSDEATI